MKTVLVIMYALMMNEPNNGTQIQGQYYSLKECEKNMRQMEDMTTDVEFYCQKIYKTDRTKWL